MAELALVTPILVLLITAVVQFAFVLETQMGLTNAVREAARRAAADPMPTAAGVQAQLNAGNGLLASNIQGFDASRLWGASPSDGTEYRDSPDVSFCSYQVGTTTNYRVTVYVAYKNPLFFPLLAFATDLMDRAQNGTWDFAAEASMRLENDDTPPPDLSGTCSP